MPDATPDQYRMPHVEIGDTVLWFPGTDCDRNNPETSFSAIVTKIGYDSINLNVLSPSSYNFMIRDGVRHMDDPKASNPELRSQGAWEHNRATKRLVAMYKKVQMMFEHLAREGNKAFAEQLSKELAERRKNERETADREHKVGAS